MSNLQPNCCLEFDFRKVDQHAGGKWLIHDTKRRSLRNMFVVQFLKNGSKFFNNTSSPAKGEYFLSYKPSQPIGRASLWDWHS